MTIQYFFLILNTADMIVAKGELQSFGTNNIVLSIASEAELDAVRGLEVVHIQEEKSYAEIYEGWISAIVENEVSIINMNNISKNMRKDFKVKANFTSTITPIIQEEYWERDENDEPIPPHPITIVASDISCGGIGFYTKEKCSMVFDYELIMPIIEEPLILKLRILRCDLDKEVDMHLCGAMFLRLRYGEESLLRRTVMRMQVQERNILKERLERAEENRAQLEAEQEEAEKKKEFEGR